VSRVVCGSSYTFYLFNNGRVTTCGVNKHGRMGIGKTVEDTVTPVLVPNLDVVGEISAAAFHSAFVTLKGKVFTCGSVNSCDRVCDRRGDIYVCCCVCS